MTTLLHSPLVYVTQTATVRGAVRVRFDIAPEDCDFILHAGWPPRRKRRLVHWVHAAQLEGDMLAGIWSPIITPLRNGELYFEAMQTLSD